MNIERLEINSFFSLPFVVYARAVIVRNNLILSIDEISEWTNEQTNDTIDQSNIYYLRLSRYMRSIWLMR